MAVLKSSVPAGWLMPTSITALNDEFGPQTFNFRLPTIAI
jgi:hypothetical protein